MQKRSLQSFLLVYFMKLIFEKEVYYAIGNERENNELQFQVGEQKMKR